MIHGASSRQFVKTPDLRDMSDIPTGCDFAPDDVSGGLKQNETFGSHFFSAIICGSSRLVGLVGGFINAGSVRVGSNTQYNVQRRISFT